ncbi:MAG TPA: thioredoxin family protein [Methylomirabilota bacterium]|nr:thioredoxin family protein [Methylomirabilota bacterium]
MVTRERFEQGLTLQQYVDKMSFNRERFVEAIEDATVGPEGARVLERLDGARRVLVISEDWCGTCLAHVPYVAKLIEGRPEIDMRFFPRDANLDLMDQYLKQGRYRSIPVFAFFDEHMNELARFLETRPS